MTDNLTNVDNLVSRLKEEKNRFGENINLTFIHIPKTGGSTIEDISKKYNYQWARWNDLFNKKLYSFKKFGGRNIINCHSWHTPSYLTYNFAIFNKTKQLTLYQQLNSNENGNTNTFCIVRNPYTRLISEYNYQTACHPNTEINQFLQKSIISFYFDKRYNYQDCHFIPQYKYIYEIWNDTIMGLNDSNNIFHIPTQWTQNHDFINNEHRVTCKYILKQENLNDEFDVLMKVFNQSMNMAFANEIAQELRNSKHKLALSNVRGDKIANCKKNQIENGIVFENKTIELIQTVYKKDFEYFCYDINKLPFYVQRE